MIIFSIPLKTFLKCEVLCLIFQLSGFRLRYFEGVSETRRYHILYNTLDGASLTLLNYSKLCVIFNQVTSGFRLREPKHSDVELFSTVVYVIKDSA